MKCSEILWKHFVIAEDGLGTSKLNRYRLKASTLTPSMAPPLNLFVSSILISTQLSVAQDRLWVDQLCAEGPILACQQQRLELARRLLVGVEVAGLLNSPQLCLQLVVKCYGVLAPLVQHRVPSRALVEMLMCCHVVLLELPGGLLNTVLKGVTVTIHHMVAAIAFYVGKVSTAGCSALKHYRRFKIRLYNVPAFYLLGFKE